MYGHRRRVCMLILINVKHVAFWRFDDFLTIMFCIFVLTLLFYVYSREIEILLHFNVTNYFTYCTIFLKNINPISRLQFFTVKPCQGSLHYSTKTFKKQKLDSWLISQSFDYLLLIIKGKFGIKTRECLEIIVFSLVKLKRL